MASKTYKTRAMVLKRVKLGETDVICVMMGTDGSLVKAVAKGARKPTSPFASRLEVFAICDLFLAKGRSLDIIKEAKLVEPHLALRNDIDRQFSAFPIMELVEKSIHEELEVPRLFDMTAAALKAMSACAVEACPNVTAAHLFKTLAFLGLKPSFEQCVGCGDAVDPSSPSILFSIMDGGVVCPNCRGEHEVQGIPAHAITWSQALLYSPFENVVTFPITADAIDDVLKLARQLIQAHLGIRLKSLRAL